MKTAVVGRGISGTQFLKWEAPDGTRVNLVAYGEKGYGGFGRDMHGFAYAGKTPKLTKEQYAKRFAKYLKKYSAITPDTLLLPDADDHSRIADNCDEEIAWIRELCPKSEFVQTDYVDLPEFDAPNLRVKRGELAETADDRGHGAMKLVQNSISSRYDIKRFNDDTQNLLEWRIEPMLASRVFFGHADKTKKSLLDMSWKTLLKNQAHDSICGCSVDEIHYEMKARYIEIRQIADGIADDLLSRPRNGVKLRRAPEGKFGRYKIDVYNPLPYPRSETLKLRIPLSLGFLKQFREPRAQESFATFEIFAEDGTKIPHAVLKVEKNQLVRYDGIVDFYTIAVKPELAPSAITTLELRAADFPPRTQTTMRNSMLSADNGRLAIAVNRDGTFDVSEKIDGQNRARLQQIRVRPRRWRRLVLRAAAGKLRAPHARHRARARPNRYAVPARVRNFAGIQNAQTPRVRRYPEREIFGHGGVLRACGNRGKDGRFARKEFAGNPRENGGRQHRFRLPNEARNARKRRRRILRGAVVHDA